MSMILMDGKYISQGKIYKKMEKLVSKETGLMILYIETERLRLESFEKRHMDGIHAITTQEEVGEFLPDWISTLEQRVEWLDCERIQRRAA